MAVQAVPGIVTTAIISALSGAATALGAALLTPEEQQRQQKAAYSNPGVGNVGSTAKGAGQFAGRMNLGSDTPRSSIASQLLRGRG